MTDLEQLKELAAQEKLIRQQKLKEKNKRHEAAMIKWRRNRPADKKAVSYQKELARITASRKERKLMLVEKFGNKCHECGGVYPAAAYQFHHITAENKRGTIARMMTGDLQTLLAEADKCIMLCANCHMIHHHDDSMSITEINNADEE